jgi:hypothetical protein
MATIDFDQFNQEARYWGGQTSARLKASARALGITHSGNSPSPGDSVQKIKDNYGLKAGVVNRIGFKFPRSLIYVHKGAGKGMGGVKGSTWITQAGNKKMTNPASAGKMGTGNRQAKPWFNDVINGSHGVDELATLVAEKLGDAITNKMFI